MKMYFVCTNEFVEKAVIKELKPQNIMISFHYFRNIDLKDFIDEIGYKPNILLDSGAYSAFTSKGKNISPIDYMAYITKNINYIDNYMALDVMDDYDITMKYYEIMRMKGFRPTPVFHYGADERYLQQYIGDGCTKIGLGKTVPITNKKTVAEWINSLTEKYPNIDFHLLGSSSPKITKNTDIYSVDSSTWIMLAKNGFPKKIKGKGRQERIDRARYQMKKLMKEFKEYMHQNDSTEYNVV